ncbi:MAG: hypothetical protein ACR2PG_25655 [Hyphomicrobiaceae bacterium]
MNLVGFSQTAAILSLGKPGVSLMYCRLRALLATVLIGVASANVPAAAELTARAGSLAWQEQRASALARLFVNLKNAGSQTEADAITSEIWSLWYKSGNEKVDLLLQQARQLFGEGEQSASIERIDEALKIAPRYAEAWNLRATLMFYMGRDVESLADIRRTLALEDRHFGALAGLVMISVRASKWKSALKALRAALVVHPYLRERGMLEHLEAMVQRSEL